MKQLLITGPIVIGALCFGTPAHAGPTLPIGLTLTAAPAKTLGPESASNPCIIAGTNCPHQPSGFGYNNYKQGGNNSSYDLYSTTPTTQLANGTVGTPYTVSQIDTTLGTDHFNVAIDVNSAKQGETLQDFQVIINTVVTYEYQGPTAIPANANKGNGYADWTLGDISLANFADGDKVLFRAVWDDASGGAESFYLLPLANIQCTDLTVCPVITPTGGDPVPEPASIALLGFGLLGTVVFARRRAQ